MKTVFTEDRFIVVCPSLPETAQWSELSDPTSFAPTGTKVDRCYKKLKHKGKGRAAAICQKATKQSLKTGRKLKK